jgi:hypothetical protein
MRTNDAPALGGPAEIALPKRSKRHCDVSQCASVVDGESDPAEADQLIGLAGALILATAANDSRFTSLMTNSGTPLRPLPIEGRCPTIAFSTDIIYYDN